MSIMTTPSFIRSVARFWALSVSLLSAGQLFAETSLQEAFAACEATVAQQSDVPLQAIGSVIDEDERGARFRVDTPEGTVVAMHIPPHRMVSACILWGAHPDLEKDFAALWQDWVEWDEVEKASQIWFEKALRKSGSVDLTDYSKPGHVIARCGPSENEIVLASQPMLANTVRQIFPDLEPIKERATFFRFSVIEALKGRCSAAVRAGEED